MTSARRLSFVTIAGLLVVSLPACSGGHEQVGRTTQPIVHGEPSVADTAVVGLVYPIGEKHAVNCTGALVSAGRVLTAAHCVSPLSPDSIVVGQSLSLGERHELRRIVIHPDYDEHTLASDLALLELAAPLEVEPLELAEAPVESDARVRLVGFGRAEVAGPPTKRTGDARVVSVDDSGFRVGPAPSLACSGDSGGPALVDDAGRERIAGIASHGDWECSEGATYTSVAHAAELLASERESAPACSVRRAPQPSRPALWIVLGLACWLRRRLT